jgi:uncharacterized membrane protein YjjP (DUF1212 family)
MVGYALANAFFLSYVVGGLDDLWSGFIEAEVA